MDTADDILKKILLNMMYDPKKSLVENRMLVTEQLKPSASAGEVETIGVIPDEVKSNNTIVSSIDYNGKPLTFNGIIYKTTKQFFDEMLNEILTMNESAYRDKETYVNSVNYVGPEWGRNYFKSYKENKMTIYDLKQKVGSQNIKYEKKLSGYEYKKNTLGYIASRCKSTLQSELKKYAEEKSIRYQTEMWYGEPNETKDCVVNSIKSIGTKLSPNSVFSFWSIDPKTYSKEYFYLGFSCGIETSSYQTDFAAFQQSQITGKEVEENKVVLPTKCDSSSIRFSGYRTTDGKKWDSVKKENVKYAEANLNKNSEDIPKKTEPKIGSSKKGSFNNVNTSDEEMTIVGDEGGEGSETKVYLSGGGN